MSWNVAVQTLAVSGLYRTTRTDDVKLDPSAPHGGSSHAGLAVMVGSAALSTQNRNVLLPCKVEMSLSGRAFGWGGGSRGSGVETGGKRRRSHGSPFFRRLGAGKGRSSPEATRASAPLTAAGRRKCSNHEIDGAAGWTAAF